MISRINFKHLSKTASASVGAGFLVSAFLLQTASRMIPGFAEGYRSRVYPLLVNSIGRISGWFPFSLSELGLYLLIGFGLLFLFRYRHRKKNLFLSMFCLCSGLFFSYTACCGVNYFSRPFSDSLDYSSETYTRETLEALLSWLTKELNEGYVRNTGRSQQMLGTLGIEAMEKLGEQYPELSGFYPRPKPLTGSWLLSVQQLAGVYAPFTVEANYNQEMVPYNIPHTICHELSHLRGFMREDEANFIAFLACIGSEDPEYRYSGNVSGWIYAGNALAAEDYEAYKRYYGLLREEVKEDLRENSRFWNQYESKISELSETVNDTYLKANRQSDGVKSYGRAVDLMLGWYRKKTAKSE